jgi:Domain of unknown function (DUF1704)
MERLNTTSESLLVAEHYSGHLETARKAFPALIRRVSNTIPEEQVSLLTAVDGLEFNPTLEYPNIGDLSQEDLAEKRKKIEGGLSDAAVIEESGHIPSTDDRLSKAKATEGLKNVRFLELAQTFHELEDGPQRDSAAEELFLLNSEMTGSIDEGLYHGVINSLHLYIDKITQSQPNLFKIAQELRTMIPAALGDNEIVSLPQQTFDEYANAYKVIFSGWLNELITEEKESYDADDIARIFTDAFVSMGLPANVEVSEDTTSIKWRKEESKFFIPSNRNMSRSQLEAKIVHEIGHLTRGWNGSQHSRAAENGLPDYLDAEDGLMSYGEEFITGERQSNPTYIERYLGAGLLTGSVDDTRRDFKRVFSAMWRARVILESNSLIGAENDVSDNIVVASRKESLINAQRLFRGGDGITPGIGWTKDKVYYEGVAKLTDFLIMFESKYGLEQIPILFAGKFDPTNEDHNRYMGMPFKSDNKVEQL